MITEEAKEKELRREDKCLISSGSQRFVSIFFIATSVADRTPALTWKAIESNLPHARSRKLKKQKRKKKN